MAKHYLCPTPFRPITDSTTSLLSAVFQGLVVDLTPYVYLIDSKYGAYLLPPPEGIYFQGGCEPVIEPERVYYCMNRGAQRAFHEQKRCSDFVSSAAVKGDIPKPELFLNLDMVKDDIVDNRGRVVVPLSVAKQHKDYLTTTPTFPVRALLLLTSVVKSYFNPHDKTHGVYQHLNDEGVAKWQQREMDFEAEVCNLLDIFDEFVGEDRHHIYGLVFVNTDVVVEKYCDFRIYEWTRLQEAKATDDEL